MVLQGRVQSVATQVVPPPLEHGDAHGDLQDFAHQGQVAVEELVLQIAGPGGGQDFAPREQGRDQVGEGLAGAGAGLADKGLADPQRGGYRFRHGLLLGTVAIAGQALGEQSCGAKDVSNPVHVGAGHVFTTNRRESIRGDSRDSWFFLAVGLQHARIDRYNRTPERAPDSTDLPFHLNRSRRRGRYLQPPRVLRCAFLALALSPAAR